MKLVILVLTAMGAAATAALDPATMTYPIESAPFILGVLAAGIVALKTYLTDPNK